MLPPSGGRVLGRALRGARTRSALLHLLCDTAARRRADGRRRRRISTTACGDAADEDERVLSRACGRARDPGRAWSAQTCARCAQGLAHLDSKTPDVVRATRSSSALPPSSSAERDCDRSHPRRPGGDLPPAVDPRGRSARAVRDRSERRLASAGRCSTSVGTRCGSGSPPSGLPFREDESNRDLAFTRNRVRHELLPLLERDFSPGIVEVLAREAAIAREDEDLPSDQKQSNWRVPSS